MSIKQIFVNFVMRFFNFFFAKKNTVVFCSFNGKQYSCNPKAISEKLHELNKKIKIIWIVENKSISLPNYVKKVKKGTIGYLFALATAKVWVDNCNKPEYLYKSKKQLYIQTWHGDCGFKRLAGDEKCGNIPNEKILKFDIAIAGSDFAINYIYKKCFCFNGKFIDNGMPRNDILLMHNNEYKNKIKNALNIDKNTKIVIFCPTFSDKYANKPVKQEFPFNISKLLITLEKSTNSKWILLYRSHHVKSVSYNLESTLCRDVSDYGDMADLLFVSDFLITDYSSSACDFILANKPAILFQIDKEYTDYRNLIVEDNENPFIIAHSEEELYDYSSTIVIKSNYDYFDKIKKFYGMRQKNNSSYYICEYIIKFCEGKLNEK